MTEEEILRHRRLLIRQVILVVLLLLAATGAWAEVTFQPHQHRTICWTYSHPVESVKPGTANICQFGGPGPG
jgi:hypothetical protein